MVTAPDVRFPCDALPSDQRTRRLLGLYEQRQDGLLMQRVKVPAGRITAGQWRLVAELARRYTPGYPLHVTTRQDIELHGLRADDVRAVQRGLHVAGLSTVGAGGDTVRNITTCAGSGVCGGHLDVWPVVEAIQSGLKSLRWIQSLPRKFKISVSACPEGCARPSINDVGLVARADGTFRAMLAGSLGARPRAGVVFHDGLMPAEAVRLVIAAVRLFEQEGDRNKRSRARLRHVRERLGDDVFRARMWALFEQELNGRPVSVSVPTQRRWQSVSLQVRLQLPCGDIHAEAAVELSEAVVRARAELRIGLEHELLVWGRQGVSLPASLEELVDGPRVVACPGETWCRRGVSDSRGMAGQVGGAVGNGSKLNVCISGCPNNCVESAVADIGLVGLRKTINGVRQECFRLLAGGGNGRSSGLGEELHPALPAEQVCRAVAWLVDEYKQQGGAAESFAGFISAKKVRLKRGIRTVAASKVVQRKPIG
jgi:sulfite reductase (ferredoxin)